MKKIFAATVYLLGLNFSMAAELTVSGPMPGFSGLRTVNIWLQANKPAKVQLQYWPRNNKQLATRSIEKTLSKNNRYIAQFQLTELTPGTRYRYTVYLNKKAYPFNQALEFNTQALWQWRHDPPNFNVALGSCAYINETAFDRPGKPYGDNFEIFNAIAEKKPDAMLWLGDNLYFREVDYEHPLAMAKRYRSTRAFAPLQTLLRSTQHYAIWDDHDFGPNNSTASFIYKSDSLALFKQYWPNPSFGQPDLPGVFTRFTLNDVEFFLLDDRYYRDSDRGPDSNNKQLFGIAQLNWVRNALLNSTATFKIVASGSQLFNDINRFEGWNHFSAERQQFLTWLKQSRIRGVFFLSGDRHHTELLKIDREGSYPLYELTCSPLTAGTTHSGNDEKGKSSLVTNTLVSQRNFCRLAFSGSRKDRVMTVAVFNSKGNALWNRKIPLAELK